MFFKVNSQGTFMTRRASLMHNEARERVSREDVIRSHFFVA
jgi:hypothetical protein